MPIDTRPAELDIDPEIAGCCRDACRVLSFEASAGLRRRGVPVRRPRAATLCGDPVRRADDGYPEWQGAGLAVEAGA